MKSFKQRTISDRIQTVRKATTNALARPAVLTKLAKKEYNAAVLNAGKSLADTADAKIMTASAHRGDQKVATDHVRDCEKAARQTVSLFASLARAIFSEQPSLLDVIGLDQAVPKRRAEFILAAKKMFNSNHGNAEILDRLEDNEWGSSELSQARSKISELEAAQAAQGQCKTDWQDASAQQKSALKAMDKWMAKFVKVARVVFADEKQQLEQLGIVARTTLTKKQRAARRNSAAARAAKKKSSKASVGKAA